MKKFLEQVTCPVDLFSELYGKDRIQLQCSSCSICIEKNNVKYIGSNIREPKSPFSLNPELELEDFLGKSGRMLLSLDIKSMTSRNTRRLFDGMLRLRSYGIYKFVEVGKFDLKLIRLKELCSDTNILFESIPRLSRSKMPDGPELIFVGSDAKISEAEFSKKNKKRIFVCEANRFIRGGRKLTDIFPGRQLTYSEFIREVN